MSFTIEGEYTTAYVKADSDQIESKTIKQIENMVNHPAFTNSIVIQPDSHPGAGSVIGFTMELGNRIIPNIVGVDVGCGMIAVCIGDELPLSNEEREQAIRDAVPMGREVNDWENSVHLVEDYPWGSLTETFENFDDQYYEKFGEQIDPIEFDFEGYGEEYFKSLCRRVLAGTQYSDNYIINGVGTLGGGNHFIELAKSESTGQYWIVIHSGSRYIGKAIAEYWQKRAIQLTYSEEIRNKLQEYPVEYYKFDLDSVSDSALFNWLQGGMGEDWKAMDAIVEEYEETNPERINELKNELNDIARIAEEAKTGDIQDSLDWLEGRASHGYYVDMLFAQHYAQWNRRVMVNRICEALDVEQIDRVESTHNYISFEDMVIRKGSTPSHEGERLIIPMNMSDGTLLCEGKGNEDWLWTAPHGAGRVMGRREAKRELDLEDFEEAMDDTVYSESVVESVRDEAPQVYKDATYIQNAIEPTADIIDRLKPVHNLKAID